MSDALELHTWSGRRHKFGPEEPSENRYDGPFHRALCNRSIVAQVRWQNLTEEDSVCKRCFPGGAA